MRRGRPGRPRTRRPWAPASRFAGTWTTCGRLQSRRGSGTGSGSPRRWAPRLGDGPAYKSLAVIVICVFRSLEMGQPVFAAFAAFSNVDLSAFGTFAPTSRWINVTANPASVFSKFTVAFVSIESGVRPSFPSSPERAIEKHPEWAAAMSSSGFVPGAFSNRCAKEYGVPFRTPLAVETVPFPSFKPPFQTAFAYRCTMSVAPADVNPGSHLTLRARSLYRPGVLAQVPPSCIERCLMILRSVGHRAGRKRSVHRSEGCRRREGGDDRRGRADDDGGDPHEAGDGRGHADGGSPRRRGPRHPDGPAGWGGRPA